MSIFSSKVIIFTYLLAPQEVFLVVLLFYYTAWRDNCLIFSFKIYDNSGTSPVLLCLNDQSNQMTQHARVVHLSAVCSVFSPFCSFKYKLGPFVAVCALPSLADCNSTDVNIVKNSTSIWYLILLAKNEQTNLFYSYCMRCALSRTASKK